MAHVNGSRLSGAMERDLRGDQTGRRFTIVVGCSPQGIEQNVFRWLTEQQNVSASAITVISPRSFYPNYSENILSHPLLAPPFSRAGGVGAEARSPIMKRLFDQREQWVKKLQEAEKKMKSQ